MPRLILSAEERADLIERLRLAEVADPLLSVREIAYLTSTQPSFWYGKSHRRDLPIQPVFVGRYLRFKYSTVREWIDRKAGDETPRMGAVK